jgi:hypothetical protein
MTDTWVLGIGLALKRNEPESDRGLGPGVARGQFVQIRKRFRQNFLGAKLVDIW